MPISNPISGGAGPSGWNVAEDGSIGIGSATYDSGCAVTVSGDGNVSLHGEQVRLSSPSSTPPSLVAAAEIGLQTDEGASSIFLRTGSAVTEYTAVSGAATDRSGHRFRTGSPARTRLSIADDAVALDVPLMLSSYSVSALPLASTLPGCLIAIPDRGSAIQLAYSDGTHWAIVGSSETA